MIRQPEFLAYANHLGVVMRKILEGWKAKYPLVGDVRGLGPMLLIELVKDRDSKEPLPAADALAIIRDANSRVLLIRAGLHSNCVRFLPAQTCRKTCCARGWMYWAMHWRQRRKILLPRE